MRTHFIFLLLCLIHGFGFAETFPEHGSPFIKNYTSTEMNGGGPQIFCWAQDHRGMVYAGDIGGVLEFNGREWRRITNTNNSVVRSMTTDSLGIVYAGGSNDFGFLQPNTIGEMEFVSLSKPVTDQGIKFLDIWKVFATSHGVYFCANKYVFRYFNKKVSVIPVDFLVQDSYILNNQLYLPTKSGLYVLRDTTLVSISPKVSFNLISLRGEEFLSVNGDGNLYTFNLKTSKIEAFKTQAQNFFENNPACEITRIDENKFAVATETNKILILSNGGGVLRYIDKTSGLMSGVIYKLFVDDDKNLWACMSKGISKIDINYPVSKFGDNNNINSTVLASCHFNGRRYIGTIDGIYYLPPFNVDTPHESQKFINIKTGADEFWDFKVVDNQLYAVSSGGLWVIDGANAKHICKIESPQKAHCFNTSKLFPNVFFVGMRGKLLALKLNQNKDINSIKVVEKIDFPEVTEKIRYIASDKDGNLWLNTQFDGVYFIRFIDGDMHNYQVTLLGKQNGLPNLDGTRSSNVNNQITIATEAGLLQPVFPTDKNAPDSLIRFEYTMLFGDTIKDTYAIVSPISENRYLIASNGMYYATINGTKQAFDSSGFFRLNFAIESISFSIDSIISLCSPDGLFNYNTTNRRNFKKPFNTIISKVEINTDSTLFGGSFYSWSDSTKVAAINQTAKFIPTIDYKYNSLTFQFAALFYENPDVTEFQHQLVGYDKKWSDWSTENKANYTNLKEGKYTFRVKAKNAYWTESNVAEYQFAISSPWYRTWWAYSIYVLLFACIIYLAIRLYTRRLKLQKEYLELVVEERTAEVIEQARELKTINEKLVEMDKFKQGVTSMIVHDLKNPINAVINAGSANPEIQLTRIKQTGRQMLNLVMNILDVSKFEETEIPLTIENHNLLGIATRAVDQVFFLSSEKNITVTNSISPELGVRADAEIIERVFVNILTNAIKFTSNNGLIVLDAENDSEEWLKISIADNGIGIPADKIHLVFQKFGQVVAKESGSVRSTGLGLTYCKMVVDAHGGAIGVDSKLEKGSEFWFTLPIAIGVEVFSQSSPKTETVNHTGLSEASREETKTQLNELQKTEFYKITEIMAILETVDDTANDEIKAWKQALIKAIDSGNEPLYKKLL